MYQRLVTRTIYGAELQTAQLNGLPYSVRENTSLNQKFEILANQPHTAGTYPYMRYIAAGCGAHESIPGADGLPGLTNVVKHRPTDAACFYHLPWVMRLTTNDLPPEQRAKYALRKQITGPDDRLYFAYYLRRLDLTNVTTQLNQVVIRDGVKSTVPFIPSNSNLNPTRPVIAPDQSVPNLINGDYVTTVATIPLELTPLDVAEYVNAATILFGDERYAVISELALVTAQDRVTTVPSGQGDQINFNEVVSAQIAQFISQHIPLAFSSQGISLTLNTGSSEALLTESASSLNNGIIN
jgi:hypothetical protein